MYASRRRRRITLGEINGSGAIQQIWMTPAPIDKTRLFILRFYWDGETEPSIEVPMGDFFACGWGKYCQINSLPVCVNPGSAFNCYWTMPFRKGAKVTLENLDDNQMTIYYQINYTLTDVPEDAAYLHAQFRRVPKLPVKTVYTILDGVRGRGHYVGTYMAWEVRSPGWWGEGEIKFFLDGDQEFPTICGTGTEDYFCGSYNFENREKKLYQTVQHATFGPGPGPASRCRLSAGPAIRTLPLAHRRPDPLRAGFEGDDPGSGLDAGQIRPIPAVGRRHRVRGVLVSVRTSCEVSRTTAAGGTGDQAHSGRDAEVTADLSRRRSKSDVTGSTSVGTKVQSTSAMARPIARRRDF